jgi:hypothetical protein
LREKAAPGGSFGSKTARTPIDKITDPGLESLLHLRYSVTFADIDRLLQAEMNHFNYFCVHFSLARGFSQASND